MILEAADSVAAAWRGRWDSLLLFTPRRYDALPAAPFPGDPDGYPTRNEVISYLERYAAEFDLPIELDSPVHAISATDGEGSSSSSRGGRSRPTRLSSPPDPSRSLACPPSQASSRPRCSRPTAPATGGQRTYRRERFSSSAAVTPASRSRRSSQPTSSRPSLRRLAPDTAAAEAPRPRPLLVAGKTRTA